MKKEYKWSINTLLYGLWLLFIFGAALFADFYDAELPRLTGRFWLLVLGVAVGAPLLLKKVRDWVPGVCRFGCKLPLWAFRGICFGCSLLVLGFCFLAVCPGGFDGDPNQQLQQAISGTYNDYYPVLHTLIAFKLPLALTGGWYPSIILFQILLFSLALTWVCDTVRIASDALRGFLSLAVILLNPITQSYLMYGYKDDTFGICAMVLVCMNARILFSRGAWLKKPVNLVLFSLMLAITSIVRHNGILFAVPCLIGAALCVSWKRTLAAAGAALLVFFGIKEPLYSALRAEKADDRSSQTMGLPMAVIGGPVTYRPDKLESDVLDFAYSVASEEVWQEKYTWGIFNWVDWDERSNHEALSEAGMFGALKYMARAFAEAPKESLKALIETTKITYSVVPDQLADGRVFLSGGDLGIRDQSIPWMRGIMDSYRGLMYIIAPHSYLHSGVTLLILLTVILARFPLNRKESWRRILPTLSVFCYNLVTMLLLFSWWDGARFFHYSIWVLPVLLVMLTRERPDKEVRKTDA